MWGGVCWTVAVRLTVRPEFVTSGAVSDDAVGRSGTQRVSANCVSVGLYLWVQPLDVRPQILQVRPEWMHMEERGNDACREEEESSLDATRPG